MLRSDGPAGAGVTMELRQQPFPVDDHPDEQYVTLTQQQETAELGMWLFLATEFLFFGAFFAAYLVYRYLHSRAFELASERMDLVAGTINTGVLLTSSFTMALAVASVERHETRRVGRFLLCTIGLGIVFLGIKGMEYFHKFTERLIPFAGWDFAPGGATRAGEMAFFNLYFLMTGIHAVHMIIGIGLLSWITLAIWLGHLRRRAATVVHNVGLYWHFVDLVWVFLFPFFYLVGAH